MILGPQQQITQMSPNQPVLYGQQLQAITPSNVQTAPSSSPTSPLSGLNLNSLAQIANSQAQAQQPNTPTQTFTGMMNAGASPQQAAQVATAPNGASGDYSAGYVDPSASSGSLSSIYQALAGLFGGNAAGGASAGASGAFMGGGGGS